ncbi:endonuclease/exonuclease/phosphatase family protein [Labedella endophytica]|uniref:Endonuclease/exonuclease/phosphatase family protein n=1 Tax=Labedella endophytica TaxID=1523160 RepID=A0A433JQJ1_9MICO|nr:endonuclease/exonuclease/phosphatase family protein [Labedella endophytica]RUQ99255.1 endonuclease/exonuclease/phosphatase family protein [Labedella endophytica]
MLRFLGALLTIALTVVCLIATWPQLFGAQNLWIVTQVVALRGVVVVGCLMAAALFALFSLARPIRAFAGAIAVVLVATAIGNAAIMGARGVGDTSFAEWTEDSVTVLTWNTLGDAPGAETIARVALEGGADVVSLPETTKATGIEVALLMKEGGNPMWVHTVAFDEIAKARSTTILVSPRLGDYDTVWDSNRDRAEEAARVGNTSVLPTVVLKPTGGSGPTIVAVHAVAPIPGQMENWRADLRWLATQCQEDNVIMAGDYNATVDHMADLGTGSDTTIGRCTDAGRASGNGAVGTWSTALPALLGSPIDHVMATPNWSVSGMRVIEDDALDASDHRPVLVQLTPSG